VAIPDYPVEIKLTHYLISITQRTMSITHAIPAISKLFDSSCTILARLASLFAYGFCGFVVPPDILAKLNECAKTDLIGTRDWWFRVLKWSTTTVAAGLILELPELVYELTDIARNRIQRLKYRIVLSETKLEIYKVVAFIGWFLIVAGVVGERYAEIRVNDLDATIQGCNDARLAETEQEAGDAKASAKTAHDEADAVSVAADKAREKVDAVAKRTDEIKRLVDWRTLTFDQEIRIRDDLMPFKGQEFTLETYQDDEECVNLYWTLDEVALSAGWKNLKPIPTMGLVLLAEFGVRLRLSPSANEFARHAAERLRSSLKHEGIDSEVTFDPNAAHSNAIQIRVGKRKRMKWEPRLLIPVSP
jgi:hypothetical protein